MITRKRLAKADEGMNRLLRLSADTDPAVAHEAQQKIGQMITKSIRDEIYGTDELETAQADLRTPLRQGYLPGDIINGIFTVENFEPGVEARYPLDIINPGEENSFVAYTIPNSGRIPENRVDSDYLLISTYDIGSSIDYNIKYARDARWPVVKRAAQVLKSSFVIKANRDAWHVIITSAYSRGVAAYDTLAPSGLFTKRAVSLARTLMRRGQGGNSNSLNRGELTDLFVSPEGIEDMRSWDLTQVDDQTRRQIFLASSDHSLNTVFGVTLHDLDELGVGQEFQNYYSNVLGGSLNGKEELAIGLDLSQNDSFYMAVTEEVKIFPDPMMHRQRREGWYGWGNQGFGAMDNRRAVILTF